MTEELIIRAVVFFSFGMLVRYIWGRYLDNDRQIPLSEYTREDFYLAFRFAPERRAEIVNRGSMSRNEFRELQKLNLERIDAELRRRGAR